MQAVPSQLEEVGWPHGKLCKEARDQEQMMQMYTIQVQACHLHLLDYQRLACNSCQACLQAWARHSQ